MATRKTTTPTQKTPAAERSMFELSRLYEAQPSAYREQAVVKAGTGEVVARFACATGLRDVEETVATLVGPGHWTVALIKESGDWGPHARVPTRRDLRPEPEPDPSQPSPQALPGVDPRQSFAFLWQQQQQSLALEKAQREKDDERRRAEALDTQMRTLAAELEGARREAISSRQKGYQEGWEEGKAHGIRITKERLSSSGEEGLNSPAVLDTVNAVLDRLAPRTAQDQRSAQPDDPLAAILRLAVSLGYSTETHYEALAHQVASYLGLADPIDLVQDENRSRLAEQARSSPGVRQMLTENAAARDLLLGFEQWLASYSEAANPASGQNGAPVTESAT